MERGKGNTGVKTSGDEDAFVASTKEQKTVRVSPEILALQQLLATKRKRGEKLPAIHMMCTIVGAFFLAAGLAPDKDGTYSGFTGEELARNIVEYTRTALDFCERHGVEVQPLLKEVRAQQHANQVLMDLLLTRSYDQSAAWADASNLPLPHSQAKGGVKPGDTDHSGISIVAITGTDETAEVFSDGGATL